MDAFAADPLAFALLNDWQRDFPLVEQPFHAIARRYDVDAGEVIARLRSLHAAGAVSRIGGVFGAGAGGAGMLCAFAVPTGRLDEVAAIVDAVPGVNHNYEREHRYNLWFVVTARDAAELETTVDALAARTGLVPLRLPMQRAYRIDLGFDLRGALAGAGAASRAAAPVAADERPLAALLEAGLPIVDAPFAHWAAALDVAPAAVLATLERWLAAGTLKRFGVVVRHHELGFAHNAMTVFDVPDDQVDDHGALLARQAGVTLAYRRRRAEAWPYNLYCMVHGRDRAAVQAAVDAAARAAGLDGVPRQTLFSARRFKQAGARYFRAPTREALDVAA